MHKRLHIAVHVRKSETTKCFEIKRNQLPNHTHERSAAIARFNTYILLLRGINVGGNQLLPMKELTTILQGMGFENVQTYIQSGNAVFQTNKKLAPDCAEAISKQIMKAKGFAPRSFVLDKKTLLAVIKANPFDTSVGKALHVFLLAKPASKANTQLLDSVKAPTESYKLTSNAFYLHAPDGIGKSKLATVVEKALGVATTARNWNTVTKLAEMAEAD
jgi:uncharacterized protein (DUF1697 family)